MTFLIFPAEAYDSGEEAALVRLLESELELSPPHALNKLAVIMAEDNLISERISITFIF